MHKSEVNLHKSGLNLHKMCIKSAYKDKVCGEDSATSGAEVPPLPTPYPYFLTHFISSFTL